MNLETDRAYVAEVLKLKLKKPFEQRFVAGCTEQLDAGIQLTQAQRDKLMEILVERSE